MSDEDYCNPMVPHMTPEEQKQERDTFKVALPNKLMLTLEDSFHSDWFLTIESLYMDRHEMLKELVRHNFAILQPPETNFHHTVKTTKPKCSRNAGIQNFQTQYTLWLVAKKQDGRTHTNAENYA